MSGTAAVHVRYESVLCREREPRRIIFTISIPNFTLCSMLRLEIVLTKRN